MCVLIYFGNACVAAAISGDRVRHAGLKNVAPYQSHGHSKARR